MTLMDNIETVNNVFKEFMILAYTEPGIRPSRIIDVSLGNFILGRLNESGYTIYILTNGDKIYIPWEWVDLFSSLNTHSGGKINDIVKMNPDNLTEIEQTIFDFIRLISSIYAKNGNITLEVVSKIKSTQKFREWLEKEYDITLDPIELYTNDNYINI